MDESTHYSSHSPPPLVQQKKTLTFAARYLGSLDVMESELVPGHCVEVVHSCIRRLTAVFSNQPSTSEQVCVCMCVCVWRERERERERDCVCDFWSGRL